MKKKAKKTKDKNKSENKNKNENKNKKKNENERIKTKPKTKMRIKIKLFAFFFNSMHPSCAINGQLSLIWPKSTYHFGLRILHVALVVPYIFNSLLIGLEVPKYKY